MFAREIEKIYLGGVFSDVRSVAGREVEVGPF
jgi:hypothetical protein